MCIQGEGKVGTYGFSVNVANKGLARMNSATQYEFQLTADSFTPIQSGTGGKLFILYLKIIWKNLNYTIFYRWCCFKPDWNLFL